MKLKQAKMKEEPLNIIATKNKQLKSLESE